MGVDEQNDGARFPGREDLFYAPRCKDYYHYQGDIGMDEQEADLPPRVRKYGRHW